MKARLALEDGLVLTGCGFGTFQEQPMRNAVDVFVQAPGPANLVLDECRFAAPPVVRFAEDRSPEPAPRWVRSMGQDQEPQSWQSPQGTKPREKVGE